MPSLEGKLLEGIEVIAHLPEHLFGVNFRGFRRLGLRDRSFGLRGGGSRGLSLLLRRIPSRLLKILSRSTIRFAISLSVGIRFRAASGDPAGTTRT